MIRIKISGVTCCRPAHHCSLQIIYEPYNDYGCCTKKLFKCFPPRPPTTPAINTCGTTQSTVGQCRVNIYTHTIMVPVVFLYACVQHRVSSGVIAFYCPCNNRLLYQVRSYILKTIQYICTNAMRIYLLI